MAESKYGKYIVTELKRTIDEAPWSSAPGPVGKGKSGRILYLDDEVVTGAFYMEVDWDFPADLEETPTEAHQHDYDEVLGFFGTDCDNPYDLCGEYELWIGDEKHIITKSCLVFIPKGLKHGPLQTIRVDRPIFAFSVGTAKMYR
jgi:hypothetical protein